MEKQVVETEKAITGRTVLSFTAPTPVWATWLFRVEFVINKVLMFWLSATSLVPQEQVKELVLLATAIDLGVWAFARSIGVKKEDIEN